MKVYLFLWLRFIILMLLSLGFFCVVSQEEKSTKQVSHGSDEDKS
jgi:hypothetical protein